MKTWVSFVVHRYTPYYDARKEFFFLSYLDSSFASLGALGQLASRGIDGESKREQ